MDKDRVAGAGKKGAGSVKEAVGKATGDRRTVAKGQRQKTEGRLVWLRAEGLPWKWITRRLGIGRTTAWRRWSVALLKISVRLNAQDEQRRLNNKAMNKRAGSMLERM